jgi:hypothetical protein
LVGVFLIIFCDVAEFGDHVKNVLGKFDYKQDMKVKMFSNIDISGCIPISGLNLFISCQKN